MWKVINEVMLERQAQEAKWGVQNHDDFGWLPILAEEFGEVANSMNEMQPGSDIEYELIQVAAVAVAWIESRRRQGLGEAGIHYHN